MKEGSEKTPPKIFQALKPSHKAQPFSSFVITSYFTITNPRHCNWPHPTPIRPLPSNAPLLRALKSRTANSQQHRLACLCNLSPPLFWGILRSPDRAVDQQLLRSWLRSLTSAPPKFCDSLPNVVERNSTPEPKTSDIARHTHKGHATQIAAKSFAGLALLVACGCLPASPEARRVGVQTKGWSRDILLALPAAFNYLPPARPAALDARQLLELCPLSSSAAFFVNELSPYHSPSVTYSDTLPW
jgi:hypothetical protein